MDWLYWDRGANGLVVLGQRGKWTAEVLLVRNDHVVSFVGF